MLDVCLEIESYIRESFWTAADMRCKLLLGTKRRVHSCERDLLRLRFLRRVSKFSHVREPLKILRLSIASLYGAFADYGDRQSTIFEFSNSLDRHLKFKYSSDFIALVQIYKYCDRLCKLYIIFCPFLYLCRSRNDISSEQWFRTFRNLITGCTSPFDTHQANVGKRELISFKRGI